MKQTMAHGCKSDPLTIKRQVSTTAVQTWVELHSPLLHEAFYQ